MRAAALTAPCSSGTRAEHVADLLSVPRRVHANNIHAALSALFCRISASSRPIKMGELLRSVCAKSSCGISLHGACEALCHWRGTIVPMVANGSLKPLVAADLDLVNMCGNAEWPCIRQATRTHFPEASA